MHFKKWPVDGSKMKHSYIYPYDWKVHTREDEKTSQDCWDVMVYVPDEEKIYLVRFGAGEDREIDLSTWNASN